MDIKTVDVDGHIMEPADLWEKNLEPKYRDRALRIAKDEEGLEYLEIDGKPCELLRGGTLASFGAAGASQEDLQGKWFKPGGVDWEDGRPPGAKDPHALWSSSDKDPMFSFNSSSGSAWPSE